MKTIAIIGGGASGMAAAFEASRQGKRAVLFERNEKLGKKIYITGKGRCNFSNSCSQHEFLSNIFEGAQFAYSALNAYPPESLIDDLATAGLEAVVERGGRIFPKSGKASDVTRAFTRLLERNNAEIRLGADIKALIIKNGEAIGLKTSEGDFFADSVILCSGGKSYPSTGSDGGGYKLAKQAGHTIANIRPALCGILSDSPLPLKLAGLTLKNVMVSLWSGGEKQREAFGELLFTHIGVSGPTILTLSCHLSGKENEWIEIDLKPALSENELDLRLQRDFLKIGKKTVAHALDDLLPSRMALELIKLSGLDEGKQINQITQKERKNIANLLKKLTLKVTGLEGFEGAVITAGGIDTKEIYSSTMQSKLVKSLYFAGEIIALHGYTGGFNLQLAFSTGMLAGASA